MLGYVPYLNQLTFEICINADKFAEIPALILAEFVATL
jgi:hypothetical protein